MRRATAWSAWLLAMACGAGAQPLQLPEGEGRELLIQVCVQCHDLRPVIAQRKTPERWQRTVHEMIWRGAPLYPGEAPVLAAYLSRAFGEGAPAAASGASAPPAATAAENDELLRGLPEGEGRELLASACTRCHGLAITLAKRKSEVEWRRSVELMAALGARLNGRDSEVLIAYLAGARGEE